MKSTTTVNDFGSFLNDNNDVTLILKAVRDLAEHMGHSLENPISLNLVCLNLGISEQIACDISVEIYKTFLSQNEQIDYSTMKKIMHDLLPESKNFSDISIRAVLKGIAKSLYPEIEPYILTTRQS